MVCDTCKMFSLAGKSRGHGRRRRVGHGHGLRHGPRGRERVLDVREDALQASAERIRKETGRTDGTSTEKLT